MDFEGCSVEKENVESHKLNSKLLQCEHCSFVTVNESDFEEHKENVHPNRCAACHYPLDGPESLTAHVAAHLPTQKDDYQCILCKCKSATFKNLERHVKKHVSGALSKKGKYHFCPDCKFICGTELGLNRHRAKQHQWKEYGTVIKCTSIVKAAQFRQTYKSERSLKKVLMSMLESSTNV